MRLYKKVIMLGMSVIVMQAVIGISQANAQENLFIVLDADQNGLISLREAAGYAHLVENFTKVDINEDGFVSMDEMLSSPFLKK